MKLLLSLEIEIKNLESLVCKMNGAVFQIPGTVLTGPIVLNFDRDHPPDPVSPCNFSIPGQGLHCCTCTHFGSSWESHLRGSGALIDCFLSLSTLLITAWSSLSCHSFHRLLSGRARSIPVVHSFDLHHIPHNAGVDYLKSAIPKFLIRVGI